MVWLILFVLSALGTVWFVVARRKEKARGDPDGKAQMYLLGIVAAVIVTALAGLLALGELGAMLRPPNP